MADQAPISASAGAPAASLEEERFLARLAEDRRAIFEGAGGLGKWIFATLVLMNAGALLAIAGRTGVTAEVIAAGQPFIWGVVAGVLAGASGWWFLVTSIVHITTIIRGPDRELSDANAGEMAAWGIVTSTLLACSLGSFVYGAASVGSALQQEAQAARAGQGAGGQQIPRGAPGKPPSR